jgi:hypothetical protein
MALQLPTLPIATTKTTLRTSGSDLTSPFGGPTQRISRLADRWIIQIDLRPVPTTQAGPIVTALISGLTEKVLCPVALDGVDLSAYSNGTVAAPVLGGTSLTHAGGGPTKFVGQFFSIVKNGVRYLHIVTAVSGSTLSFKPMLKVPLAGGEVLEFGAPKVEGFLEGNEHTWSVGRVANLGTSFTVVEAQ